MIRPGRKGRGAGQAGFRAIMRAGLGLMLLIALTYIPADMSRVRAETVPLPEDPSAYTQKKSNYIPEYEYCMHRLFSQLPELGNEPVFVTVPGFSGDMEEVNAFARYVYQNYDYTGRLLLSYLPSNVQGQYILQVWLDNPGEIYRMQEAVESELIRFSRTLDGMAERDKVIAINGWIAANAVYDTTLEKSSCYSNIMEGTSTCNGYARAFLALCSYSGIICENVRGYTDGKLHMWNRVKLGDGWEYVDVTWNSMAGSDRWLLVLEERMRMDHVW